MMSLAFVTLSIDDRRISRQFDVHANQIYQWKNQLLERGDWGIDPDLSGRQSLKRQTKP
jgi:transposase-like protein